MLYLQDTDNETVDLQITFKGHSKSSEMAQFNKPHTTFY